MWLPSHLPHAAGIFGLLNDQRAQAGKRDLLPTRPPLASSPPPRTASSPAPLDALQAGKPPLGFLNQLLYANPDALHDISKGSGYGCDAGAEPGWPAVPGWDAVTGRGTRPEPHL